MERCVIPLEKWLPSEKLMLILALVLWQENIFLISPYSNMSAKLETMRPLG